MQNSVFITGGSKGIGAATVREFSRAGKRVAFTYKTSEKEAEALSLETGAHALYCDVADVKSAQEAVSAAQRLIGDISVLVNNAGISKTGLLHDMNYDEWREIMAVNADSLFTVTTQVIPMMIRNRCGRIINISSVWGVCGAACEVAYSASKATCIGFTRALSKELASAGITVNAIAPGMIDTDMNRHYSKSDMQLILDDIPSGRIGTPNEVAQLALFLSSDAASYITGQVIGIDGGFGR